MSANPTTTNHSGADESTGRPHRDVPTYCPPELRLVGNARDVVLGPPGGGFDGPYGITEPQFEFEEDGVR